MAPRSHQAPATPDDWIAVCQRELQNLAKAYRAGLSNDTKVNHSLHATEAVLKAVVWRKERWPSWPKREGPYRYLYAHKFEMLLDNCGLREPLDGSPEHLASWKVLVNAQVKQWRYSSNSPSDDETNEIARSARHPDKGIVPWLMWHYRQKT